MFLAWIHIIVGAPARSGLLVPQAVPADLIDRLGVRTSEGRCAHATLGWRLADRPTPRRPEAERRTSAKKRKSLKPLELRAVCEKLPKRARGEDTLLLKLLANNVTFGLRPREYEGALVGEIYLVVQNAKATNGRALSATRELALERLSEGQLKSLQGLIEDMEAAAAGDVVALIDRLGARLRRVCKSLKIVPFSLYTTRHQAIANKRRRHRT